MRPLRLYHKLLITMAGILILQAVLFYSLVKYEMEMRTATQVGAQLVQANTLFKNFCAAQARLLSIVVRSVAESPIIRAQGEALGTADADVAEIAKEFLEQSTGLVRTVQSDLLLLIDKKRRVLTRIVRTGESSWSYERAYGKSELSNPKMIAATSGTVPVLLRYPVNRRSIGASDIVTEVVELPAGSLLAADRFGFVLPAQQQKLHDGSIPKDMTWLDQVIRTSKKASQDKGLPVGFWVYHDELYQIAFAPLVFAEYDDLVGVVVVGYRIGKPWAEEIKNASHSDVAIFLDKKMVATSFPKEKEEGLQSLLPHFYIHHAPMETSVKETLRDKEPLEFDLGDEAFRGIARLLPGTRCNYLVALSWTEALKPLMQLQADLKKAGLLIFCLAFFITSVFARSITRPLAGLSGAMEKVMTGDFSSRIRVLTPREVAELATVFNSMVQGLSEREQYKKMVSRSASALVQKLATAGGEAREVSTKVEATVLFSDIRSFTTLSESMSPEAVVDMLNEYFSAMGRVIAANDGDIDKFIGDAIMAFFKSTPERDSAESAVLCAIQMQHEMRALNARRQLASKPEIKIGVGVNTGLVVEGHVGTENRFEHTMLGDTVNVASRLEGECKRGQYLRIVISQSTYERVQRLVEAVPMGSAKLKGKTEELPIYEVKGLADVTQLLQGLDDPSPQVRIRAVERMARLVTGEQLEPLFSRLADSDPEVRAFTAGMIGQSAYGPKALDRLLVALDMEKEEGVRLVMLEALGCLGGIGALDHLRKALLDPSAAARRQTVLALEALGGRAAADLLTSAAQDPDGEVRATAALAMFRVGRSEGMSNLETMMAMTELPMRRGATRGLGELGVELSDRWHVADRRSPGGQQSYYLAQLSERVAALLIAALHDASPEVRVLAIQSLCQMRHRAAVKHLTELVTDAVPAVAREAREAILKFQA